MKKKVYTILDTKGCSVGPLVVAVNRDDILRSVADALRADNLMSRYPADFNLLEIGQIDVTTGAVSLLPEYPLLICSLDELLQGDK